MTSSLVGSEMCIRDRLKGGHKQGQVAASAGDALHAQRLEGPIAASQNTVSYTHLTLPTICSV
eukprot:787785-Prorocentrum_lima.AAC.1